jgi:uncharacterized protein YwqG
MTREEAIATIRRADSGNLADTMVGSLCPSILIDALRVPLDDLPIGASRIGGVPDLPVGFKWPRWSGSRTTYIPTGLNTHREVFYDKYLHFIAQLNLQELRGFSACAQLPSQGTLYFFYDRDVQPWGFTPEDHLGARVKYVDGPIESLHRRAAPEFDSDFQSHPCRLSFSENWTIPGGELRFGPTSEPASDFYDELESLRQDLIGASDNGQYQPVHRLFGWPEAIQGDMQYECQLVANGIYCGGADVDPRGISLEAGAKDWRLLLQIDTDEENPGWMWGDCGRIYYWIHKDDLARRRFKNARLILQCS